MRPVEWFIARRYLRGSRRASLISLITWISTGGVFLGSLVLVGALSVANGFESEVRDRIVGTLAHARLMNQRGRAIANYDSLRTVVLKIPGIKGVAPYILGKGGVEHDNLQEGVMFCGVDWHLESTVSELHNKMKFGHYNLDSAISNRDRKLPGVIVGSNLADKLGVREGSEVVLMSLVQQDGATDPAPRMLRCVVKGVFETGMYEYDMSLVYVSIESAQFMFATSGAEGLSLKTASLFEAPKIAKKVLNVLGSPPYTTVDWQEQNSSLFQWMKLEKLVIFLVISMIMVVAAFNIVSSLIMMIEVKRREIGILMSMGLDQKGVMRIFLINGTLAGLAGSTAGILLGLGLCLIQQQWHIIPLPGDIYFIDHLPVKISPIDIAVIFVVTNIICFVMSVIPAFQASKMLPAESMRYE